MGQNWHISAHKNVEEEVLEPDWRDMVGRLDEDIAGVGERQQMARTQPSYKVLDDVVVGAGNELQRNGMLIERQLQLSHGIDDLGSGVVVDTRKNVWRASNNRYAVVDKGARHLQRDRQITRTIVDARQNVAMQIDHCDLGG